MRILLSQVRGNFYPRPPRGGRLYCVGNQMLTSNISIHALREEGDLLLHLHGKQLLHISIHALREEGDGAYGVLRQGGRIFLSTPSARRATLTASVLYSVRLFLSTPSARRATA